MLDFSHLCTQLHLLTRFLLQQQPEQIIQHEFKYPSVLFITMHGTAFELLCDNGTNFIGGVQELREAFHAMAPGLWDQLSKQKSHFQPHEWSTFQQCLGGDVDSVKMALGVILREQSAPEPGLHTIFTDFEGILNAKSLRSTPALERTHMLERPLSKLKTRPRFNLSPVHSATQDAEDHQVFCFLSNFKCLQDRHLGAAVRKPYRLRTMDLLEQDGT